MDTRNIERKIAVGARLVTLLATMASTLGAIIMIVIGLEDTFLAVWIQLGAKAGPMPPGDATAIRVISALDRFLMAIVLLYFAYGVYVLFVRPEKSTEELGIPKWLRIEGIGQLKQTVAEVIVVVLFVLFLRVAMETFVAHGPEFAYGELLKLLTLPVSIFLLAAALKLAELHPKKGTDAEKETRR
ncbi:MAG: YqhA family protein [Arenicellales bacterium]